MRLLAARRGVPEPRRGGEGRRKSPVHATPRREVLDMRATFAEKHAGLTHRRRARISGTTSTAHAGAADRRRSVPSLLAASVPRRSGRPPSAPHVAALPTPLAAASTRKPPTPRSRTSPPGRAGRRPRTPHAGNLSSCGPAAAATGARRAAHRSVARRRRPPRTGRPSTLSESDIALFHGRDGVRDRAPAGIGARFPAG
jgi:hypothetical protein